jgi:hypothetical protein
MKAAFPRIVLQRASILGRGRLQSMERAGLVRLTNVLAYLWLVPVLLLVGCGAEKDSLFEEDHEVPAHWPSNLMDASEKIDQRLALLAGKTSPSPAESGQQDAPQLAPESCESELRDLVAWIPEVVADTDLTEEQWLPVYELCEVMRDHLSSSDVSAIDIEEDFRKLQALLRDLFKQLQSVAESAAVPQEPAAADLNAHDPAEAEVAPRDPNAGDQS